MLRLRWDVFACGGVMLQKKMAEMLKQIEDEEKAQIVRLGDASIASPFTSKLSTTQCGLSASHCVSCCFCCVARCCSFLSFLLMCHISYVVCSDEMQTIGQNHKAGRSHLQEDDSLHDCPPLHCHWKQPPRFKTEGHTSMTKSGLACVCCVQVYWVVSSCLFFLCRLVLFTLVISFVSKGFPYKDQIEELFIVMVFVCITNT